MRTLQIGAAAREIKQACIRARERTERSPFFFIVGAGLSYPPVLLANQIVEHCRDEAMRWGHVGDAPSQSPVDIYSYWFAQAYPQASDRQSYLRRMMEKAHISRANFRLAHLLLDGTIGRIVVTPNFDDLLSRALHLFGRRPIICDHPQTVERISVESSDVQIVHVHGTYWFYDCANLKEELDRASYASGQEAFTMAALLDDIFRSRVPLVIGYSGWEGDVIMSALRRRLAKPLPRNIYWFCYHIADLELMPKWLKDSASVVAVIPDPDRPTHKAASPNEGIGGPGSEPTLDATLALDTLIRELGLEPPDLTRDPLAFFAQQLRGSLWTEDAAASDDVYAIHAVIDRVERARALETTPAAGRPSQLEAMRDALRRSDYREAIRDAERIDLDALAPPELREIAMSMAAAAESLLDDSDEELAGYSLAVEATDRLVLLGGADEALALTAARALLYKGVTFGNLGRSEEAIATYDGVVQRFGAAPEGALREYVGNALLNKGTPLGALNRHDEEIAAYDEILRRFGDAPEATLRAIVAKALRSRGITLWTLDRSEDAFRAYDEIVRRYGDAADTALREEVAKALLNKGVRLGRMKRVDEELEAYDEVVRRFGDDRDAALRGWVAGALRNKGLAHHEQKRSDEELAAYDELIRRFGDAAEPAVREHVAEALMNKAAALDDLNRSHEALAICNEVVTRFGGDEESAVRQTVERARARIRALLSNNSEPQQKP